MSLIQTIRPGTQYGALHDAFHFDLEDGYTVLVGPNNAGKSALLHIIYRTLLEKDGLGLPRVAMVLTERAYVEPTTQTGTRTLQNWNEELVPYLRGQPLQYGSNQGGPPRSELLRLLMHGDFIAQYEAINELLIRFGLRPFRLSGPQELRFEELGVYVQGSGLRGVLPILAALSNSDVRAIVIDEPELSLEPRLQKVLRDVLIAAAQEKVIVVATHSHLFLDRERIESNQLVTREGNETVVRKLTTREELYEVTFDLLGSSTEDLFFPRNYVIVEGASDQVIVEKVLELLGTASPTIKVLAARGIDAVRNAVESVVRALVPLVVNDSPYAKQVVALIDNPKDPDAENVRRLQLALDERLFILDAPSIESYIPEAIYERAGRSRADDLAGMDEFRSNYERLRSLKRDVSNALAGVLIEDDLDQIPTVTAAARKAIDPET
jgi:ABC-type multidrug transport system ATPase subunit